MTCTCFALDLITTVLSLSTSFRRTRHLDCLVYPQPIQLQRSVWAPFRTACLQVRIDDCHHLRDHQLFNQPIRWLATLHWADALCEGVSCRGPRANTMIPGGTLTPLVHARLQCIESARCSPTPQSRQTKWESTSTPPRPGMVFRDERLSPSPVFAYASSSHVSICLNFSTKAVTTSTMRSNMILPISGPP